MAANSPKTKTTNYPLIASQSTDKRTNTPNAMDALMNTADQSLIEYPEERRGFAVDRFAGLVRLAFNGVIVLIFIRFVLKLIAAQPNQPFAAGVYAFTESLVAPFYGIVGNPTFDPESLGTIRLREGQVQNIAEFTSIFAIMIYWLVGSFAAQFIRVLFGKPRRSTNSLNL